MAEFRSLVFSFLVVQTVFETYVNAFAIRGTLNATSEPRQDLTVEESIQLEVKHDIKPPKQVILNLFDKNVSVSTSAADSDTISNTRNFIEISTQQYIAVRTETNNQKPETDNFPINKHTTPNDKDVNTVFSDSFIENMNSKSDDTDSSENIPSELRTTTYLPRGKSSNVTDVDETMKTLKTEKQSNHNKSMQVMIHTTSQETSKSDDFKQFQISTVTLTDKSFQVTPKLPSWKKYTLIERKRTTPTNKISTAMKSVKDISGTESSEALEGTKTSETVNINDLKSDVQLSTKIIETVDNLYTPLKMKQDTVSSKRAGYLDYSTKQKAIVEGTFNSDSITPMADSYFEDSTNPGIKTDGEPQMQRDLNEDVINEELLKETMLKNEEENAERYREERYDYMATTSSLDFDINDTLKSLTEMTLQLDNTTDDQLDVKPISNDKNKTTILYPVNPNYKPMKKIEVQPPKSFLRDPDDNSWRNESISSLGIVFKPKNSSKPLTQVLKNKTETEWNNVLSKSNKNEKPDLRVRLEKMAEKRKSSKKKGDRYDIFGNVIYNDYEENNSSEDATNTSKAELLLEVIAVQETTGSENFSANNSLPVLTTTTILPEVNTHSRPELTSTSQTMVNNETQKALAIATKSSNSTVKESWYNVNPNTLLTLSSQTTSTSSNILTTSTSEPRRNVFNVTSSLATPVLSSQLETNATNVSISQKPLVTRKLKYNTPTTKEQKKFFNIFEYYDTTDEDDADYSELAKMELKKFTTVSNIPLTTFPPMTPQFTSPLINFVPERKVTIQYFPPRKIHKQKAKSEFDNNTEKKAKTNWYKSNSVSSTVVPLKHYNKYPSEYSERSKPVLKSVGLGDMYKNHDELYKNNYQSYPQRVTELPNEYEGGNSDNGFNRASYVIKNYRDFLNQAARDYEYDDRDVAYMPLTEAPVSGVTLNELIAGMKPKVKADINENYDYDSKFRTDVLQRFVDNFNHNNARHSPNFPVLYNSTVLHVDTADDKVVPPSRAFLKGHYNPAEDKPAVYMQRDLYDPNCENVTVELSPAYELHYYVPEQEEKEELEQRPSRYK